MGPGRTVPHARMTCDLHGAWENTTNFHAPLFNSASNPAKVLQYSTDEAVAAWRDPRPATRPTLNELVTRYTQPRLDGRGSELPGLASFGQGSTNSTWPLHTATKSSRDTDTG